jgi:CysZ protein
LFRCFSPPLRAVLWKSIGLAVALIVIVAIALDRLIAHLAGRSRQRLGRNHNRAARPSAGEIAIAWLLIGRRRFGHHRRQCVADAGGDRVGRQLLRRPDREEVEREHYPADPPGAALPLWLAIPEGIARPRCSRLRSIFAPTPFLLFAGFGAMIFFLATAWLLGREYFKLAAMRFRSPAEARALRKRNAARSILGGLLIAAFVSIPIVNLATPLFAMA